MTTKKGKVFPYSILVVEDNPTWSKQIAQILTDEGYLVETVASREKAVQFLETRRFDLMILDLRLSRHPGDSGMKILAQLKQMNLANPPQVILLTGFGTPEYVRAAFKDFHVRDYLPKENFSLERFIKAVREALPARREILIGPQTFEKFIHPDFLYIDKTAWVNELIKSGQIYFLSRPRRFGKSVLISTLEAVFRGEKKLFRGLAIERAGYDFKPYPVIRLDFSKYANHTPDILEAELHRELDQYARRLGQPKPEPGLPISSRFRSLVENLGQQVVLLVDEYDKPILDHITDLATAVANRDLLANFFGVLKGLDPHLRFVFITGVTRFAKVSIFSDLNSLEDITMSPRYADIAGFNEAELTGVLWPYLQEFAQRAGRDEDRVLSELRAHYNGYRFSSAENRVYNPWSLLNTLKKGVFNDYWFSTGTPSFLLKLMNEDSSFDIRDMRGVTVSSNALDTFDLRRLQLVPLLYQSGYLTILAVNEDNGMHYHLGYPNEEVERAFATFLLNDLMPDQTNTSMSALRRLGESLIQGELDLFFEILNRDFFSAMPYDLQIPREKYYTSIFHLIFLLLGMKARPEEKTNIGRIDEVVETPDGIYIFEFKYLGSTSEALAQIKAKNYAQKFMRYGKKIVLAGVNINKGGVSEYRTSEP